MLPVGATGLVARDEPIVADTTEGLTVVRLRITPNSNRKRAPDDRVILLIGRKVKNLSARHEQPRKRKRRGQAEADLARRSEAHCIATET